MKIKSIYNKRAQAEASQMSFQKIIAIVIILLVILGVTVFMLRAQLLDWVKNALPSYGSGESKDIAAGGAGAITTSKTCPVKTTYYAVTEKYTLVGSSTVNIFDSSGQKTGVTWDVKNQRMNCGGAASSVCAELRNAFLGSSSTGKGMQVCKN